MYIFERFAIPEHPEISYQLADGLSRINIKRCDDDTFLSHPKSNFIGTPIPDDIPDWVIYHGYYRNFKLLGGSSRWPLPVRGDQETIEDNISFGLQKMLEYKVQQPLNKFQHHVSSSNEIVARLSSSNRIELFSTRHGGNISYCFQALTEKFILDFAVSYAVRCHYGNPPFVIFPSFRSYPGGRLRRYPGGWYSLRIIEFAEQMPHQVIVINWV